MYATEDVACALFFAVVDRRRVRWCTARCGRFYLDPLEADTAPWTNGAVYVLDRGDFDEVDGNLLSSTAVKAVGKVAVSLEAFPLLDRVQYSKRAAWLAAERP